MQDTPTIIAWVDRMENNGIIWINQAYEKTLFFLLLLGSVWSYFIPILHEQKIYTINFILYYFLMEAGLVLRNGALVNYAELNNEQNIWKISVQKHKGK